jgi:hypothetical protein
MFDHVAPLVPLQRKENPSIGRKGSQNEAMRPNNAWREDMFAMSRNGGSGGEAPVQMKSAEEEQPAQKKEEEEKPAQMKSAEEEQPAQKKEEEEKPAQMKSAEEEQPAQKKEEEEKPAQMKSAEEEQPAQKKEEEEKPAQMKSHAAAQSHSPASKGRRTHMPAHVQRKMENNLGADFSNTRIHADSDNASRMKALAYTQGEDVYFARGQYDPESKKGQELLGHELHHVVQQREGRVQPNSKQQGVGVNNDHALEREADQKGKAAAEAVN